MATASQASTDSLVIIDTAHRVEFDPRYGYHRYLIGSFRFERDEYFVRVTYPKGTYVSDVSAFLRAMMRDVAWGFFYGWVNFDEVFGTVNHYGSVDVFVGSYNAGYKAAGTDFIERFDANRLMGCFKALLSDWTNAGFDPFAAPLETGSAYGSKHGNNDAAVNFQRELAERFVGLPGDTELRTDARGFAINRQFADVPQDEPEVETAPGFEGQLSAFNLFAYLSRSPVTWNPSIVSVVGQSAYCPTSEEHILPILHGNDRVEWFIQLSDEITWQVNDKATAAPRAIITMKAGDIAAMPADISHRGFSPKRSMLLVWENMTPGLEERYGAGELPPTAAEF
ncbi:MAG: hydroxyquinol 1,2-dioxygenase [Gammaproteobacteria bacterium]|nr:hydroxyquinol 1,2-dioxygenase [Gammaproteobacteria bacterium]